MAVPVDSSFSAQSGGDAMNCPKCGAKQNENFTDLKLWLCGSSQVPGLEVVESTRCFRNQLATVTAERDAARAELAVLLNTRSSPLVEPENLVVKIYPVTAEKGATP
jgi:hypothetical protein